MAAPVSNAYTATVTARGGAVNTWASASLATEPPDTQGATCADPSDGATNLSDYLDLTNFLFAVPSGATINGITVVLRRKVNTSVGGPDHAKDSVVKLLKGGSEVGDNKADSANWPSSYTDKSYGGASDLWGTTLAPSDVNASNFGVRISTSIYSPSETGYIQYVDAVEITVHYTPSPMPTRMQQEEMAH